MYFIKAVVVCFIFIVTNNLANAESQAPDQDGSDNSVLKSKEEFNGQFDSILSLGFRPKKGKADVNFLYYSSKYSLAGYLSSTTSTNTTKLADFDVSSSYVATSFRYGLTDDISVGVNVTNAFSQSSKITYTSSAKTSGFSDSSENRSGIKEPTLLIESVLNESEDLLIVGTIGYAPSTGTRSTQNSLEGGSSTKINLDFYKANGNFEFSAGFGFVSYSARKSNLENSTSETTGGNQITAKVGLNFLLTPQASLLIQFDRAQIDSARTKYSTTSTDYLSDSTGQAMFLLGYQYALSKDMAFLAGYSNTSYDATSGKSGTLKITTDQTNSPGIGLGLKFKF